MPATLGGGRGDGFVLGVDGCRSGWLAVELCLESGDANPRIFSHFRDIYALRKRWRAVAIDMPIGLCARGRRACDMEARKTLGGKRAASVFSPPRRPMLAFETYGAANAWGKAQGPEAGGGLSKQAWMITPKIREVDDMATPADQAWMMEAHPEIAFYRLNSRASCAHSKRSAEGQKERKRLLKTAGIDTQSLLDSLPPPSAKTYAIDDLYDAAAIALTAKARLAGEALKLGDGTTDARGLAMEIWG